MLEGNGDKISRYLGSFYNLKFPENSLDLIYMSQAFHHAEKPLKLIQECDKVLKSNGRIILVGEHYIGAKRMVFRFLSTLVFQQKFSTNFYELFTPDNQLGDHYYRQSDYYFMFQSMGYSVQHEVLNNGTVIYIADKG
jgi:ubiquinone/menaquinone biosynthesis C-methylase UbiE